MYRQTNIGGTAAPRPSVPIALFSWLLLLLLCPCRILATGPCGGVENRYRTLRNEGRC